MAALQKKQETQQSVYIHSNIKAQGSKKIHAAIGNTMFIICQGINVIASEMQHNCRTLSIESHTGT